MSRQLKCCKDLSYKTLPASRGTFRRSLKVWDIHYEADVSENRIFNVQSRQTDNAISTADTRLAHLAVVTWSELTCQSLRCRLVGVKRKWECILRVHRWDWSAGHPLGFGSSNVWRNHKVTHATGASRRCLKSSHRSFLSTPATLAKDSLQWRGLIFTAGMQCTVNKRAERPEEGTGALLTQRGSSPLTFPSWLEKSSSLGTNAEEQSLMKLSFSRKCKERELTS